MPWTWKQIEQDWLLDGRVAPDPSTVVEAFERVEAAFGRDWIEQSPTLPSVVPKGAAPQVTIDRGAYPVRTVVKMGTLLASLEGNTWRGRAHRQASPRRACSHRRGHGDPPASAAYLRQRGGA